MSDIASSINQTAVKDRLVLGAYLALLLVPLLLLLDVELAWRFPAAPERLAAPPRWWVDFGPISQLVYVVCCLWLICGLGAILLSKYLKLFSFSKLQGPLVAAYALCLTLLVVEVAPQLLPHKEIMPALWPPSGETILAPDPAVMPGVHGVAKFTGNDVGLRGTAWPRESDVFKIIAVGGSTTEALFLDDSETWPHLLMEGVNARRPESPVWVGNAGQSGRNTVEHLVLMESLPVLSKADLLIFLIGLNDFAPVVAFGGISTQEILEQRAEEFRRQVLRGGGWTRPPRPYFKHSKLYALFRNSRVAQLASLVPSPVLGQLGVGPGTYHEAKRQLRAQAPVVSMPDLEIGLDEYRQRIRRLANECRDRRLSCLFLTQPSMFRDDLTPFQERLLWFGWVNGDSVPIGYVSTGDLAQGLDAYNQTLLEVCRQDGLECYDLASKVPKDTSAFYDDAHFNEGGSRIVGRLLTDYLLSTQLLQTPSSEPHSP